MMKTKTLVLAVALVAAGAMSAAANAAAPSHHAFNLLGEKDGRLLVFYRDPALDARAKFREDEDGLYRKAEANWPALAR